MGDGDSAKTNPDEKNMCHLRLENCCDVVVSGNTFVADGNDSHQGTPSPKYCFVTEALKNVIISCNAVQNAATDQILYDLGNHYIPNGLTEGTAGTDGVLYEASETYGINYGLVYKDNIGGIANAESYMPGGFFLSSIGSGSQQTYLYMFESEEGDLLQLFENGDASISLDGDDPQHFTSLTASWEYDAEEDQYLIRVKGGRGFYKESFPVGTELESRKEEDEYLIQISSTEASFDRTLRFTP